MVSPPQRLFRRGPVYPHACGDGATTTRAEKITNGLSPRMWGWFFCIVRGLPPIWSIPTHVGMVRSALTVGPLRSVYPHACGDGVDRYFSRQDILRSIPTHVGMVQRRRERKKLRTVYPHACGDGFGVSKITVPPVGLSPRMWGWCKTDDHFRFVRRSIPTHVGMVVHQFIILSFLVVYPHACGDGRSNTVLAV